MPPSTTNADPFTNDDSSLARKSAAFTISRGLPSRPVGQCTCLRANAAGSSPKIASRSGVSTGPGQSAFTRTPSRANWTPSSLLIDSTAPFDAVYEICDVAAPRIATNEATLITEPPPRSSRYGIPCLQQRKTPFVFTSCTRCHASTDVSSTDASSAGRDAGVVVEDVDPAETLGRRLVHALDVRLVRDVRANGEGLAGAERHGFLRQSLVDIGRAHLRAFLGEDDRRLPAHAAARAGDDADLSFESPHHASARRRDEHGLLYARLLEIGDRLLGRRVENGEGHVPVRPRLWRIRQIP